MKDPYPIPRGGTSINLVTSQAFRLAAKKAGGFLTILHSMWVAHLKAEHPRWVAVFEFPKSDEN